MGRPRKPDRLTRTLTARVSDAQYDWLAERAIDEHRGDLSKALRDAIDEAVSFRRLLNSPDPPAELASMIERGRQDEAHEVAEDEGE